MPCRTRPAWIASAFLLAACGGRTVVQDRAALSGFVSVHGGSADPSLVEEARRGRFSVSGRVLELRAPLDWNMDPFADRSWRFWLHAWHWLEPLLHHHAATGDPVALSIVTAHVLDWVRQHPAGGPGQSEFAWYDMAVGARAAILGYLVRVHGEQESDPDVRAILEGSAHGHALWLADMRNYTAAHNHGLYQDAGLAILAGQLPGVRGARLWSEVARHRFSGNLAATVSTRDAIHLEHSPAYHFAITGLVGRLGALVGPEGSGDLVERMRGQAPWFVFPDGLLVQLGDTDLVAPPAWVDTYPRPAGLMFAPEAGFAAVAEGGEHLVVASGHHGRGHKHADELTFCWFAAGRRIAVDSGRFGYDYDDPGRRFAESQRAHNVLALDGVELGARGRRPFGSGIRWADADGGWFVIRGDNPAIRDEGLHHERVWLSRPGSALFVLDLVRDEGGSARSLRRYLHAAPGLRVEDAGGRTWGLRANADEVAASIFDLSSDPVSVRVVRGQTEPHVQGFTFPASRIWAENDVLVLDSGAAAAPLCLGFVPGDGETVLGLEWVEGGPGEALAIGLRIGTELWVIRAPDPRSPGGGLVVIPPR